MISFRLFGARPAVQGFYRVASAIWYLTLVFFDIHWTQFCDDCFLVAGEAEGPHVDLIQESLLTINDILASLLVPPWSIALL